ncbi:hypothetical protein G6O67_000015 [Ophiocordyceps sinensis]|uniref:Uncharacterized protein n=1 Tax=Ophiocordyceps sinensis TaxID=72228 RepID=A0A8H4PYC2_9HYPO|nr:hypothetical protein G6O67_000015 [Ophiocordyceps sinensis]
MSLDRRGRPDFSLLLSSPPTDAMRNIFNISFATVTSTGPPSNAAANAARTRSAVAAALQEQKTEWSARHPDDFGGNAAANRRGDRTRDPNGVVRGQPVSSVLGRHHLLVAIILVAGFRSVGTDVPTTLVAKLTVKFSVAEVTKVVFPAESGSKYLGITSYLVKTDDSAAPRDRFTTVRSQGMGCMALSLVCEAPLCSPPLPPSPPLLSRCHCREDS